MHGLPNIFQNYSRCCAYSDKQIKRICPHRVYDLTRKITTHKHSIISCSDRCYGKINQKQRARWRSILSPLIFT